MWLSEEERAVKVVEFTRTEYPAFYVVGVALSRPATQSLSAAFPRRILHSFSADLREHAAHPGRKAALRPATNKIASAPPQQRQNSAYQCKSGS